MAKSFQKAVLAVCAAAISLSACTSTTRPAQSSLQNSFAANQVTSKGFGIQSVSLQPRVLMVIANRDFHYGDYSQTRQSLEAAGVAVSVAAATRSTARPHVQSGEGADGGLVTPDLALSEAQSQNYDAILFVGGWGASIYQYGFTGSYSNSLYNGSTALKEQANRLINEFLTQGKEVSALCHGVTALAYARVNGISPLQGRRVVGYNGAAPAIINSQQTNTSRLQIESNGATMLAAGSVGNPTTAADDVVVDGQIITAENFESGNRLGQVLAQQLFTRLTAQPEPTAVPTPLPTAVPTPVPTPIATAVPTPEPVKPVLMVIANRDFYYREYAVPRAELEAAGLQVRVAATARIQSFPHVSSGQGNGNGMVMPDLTLEQVRSEDYSAILFVGGWGSSEYQYAFPGQYVHSPYNGNSTTKATVNRLIGEFSAQNKYLTAICHGVSVLAWARVNGSSPLAGRRATGGPYLPNVVNNAYPLTTRWYIQANQGIHVPSRSIGNPATAADDVIVDGRVIVAEDYDSAELFGRTLAARLRP